MTRVLIDSSAWIHFFNRSSKSYQDAVSSALREDRAATCGPVVMEVLRGAKTIKEKGVLSEHFQLLEYLPLFREDYWQASDLGSQLARNGQTIKTIDLLIALLSRKHRLCLLHDDRDFQLLSQKTELKTLYFR